MVEPSDAERAAMARDLRRQERGPTPPGTSGVLAPGYVQVPGGAHPDHGEAVVFAPGELLPGWLTELLREQRPETDGHGVYRPEVSKRRGKR